MSGASPAEHGHQQWRVYKAAVASLNSSTATARKRAMESLDELLSNPVVCDRVTDSGDQDGGWMHTLGQLMDGANVDFKAHDKRVEKAGGEVTGKVIAAAQRSLHCVRGLVRVTKKAVSSAPTRILRTVIPGVLAHVRTHLRKLTHRLVAGHQYAELLTSVLSPAVTPLAFASTNQRHSMVDCLLTLSLTAKTSEDLDRYARVVRHAEPSSRGCVWHHMCSYSLHLSHLFARSDVGLVADLPEGSACVFPLAGLIQKVAAWSAKPRSLALSKHGTGQLLRALCHLLARRGPAAIGVLRGLHGKQLLEFVLKLWAPPHAASKAVLWCVRELRLPSVFIVPFTTCVGSQCLVSVRVPPCHPCSASRRCRWRGSTPL